MGLQEVPSRSLWWTTTTSSSPAWPTCSSPTATGWSSPSSTPAAVKDDVDIALYDSFAQPESDQQEIKVLVDNPRARRVVVYTWNFHPDERLDGS